MSAAEVAPAALYVLHVLLVAVMAVSVSVGRQPTAALARLLVMIFVPGLGVVAYLLVRTARLPAGRRARQQFATHRARAREDLDATADQDTWPRWLPTLVRMNRQLGALPMVPDNSAELITGYEQMIARMAADIDQAKVYVHVEFFILVQDETTTPFFDALARARQRGVTVRVLVDHLSQLTYPRRRKTAAALAAMGAELRAMLPLSPVRAGRRLDLRNHRKLVVVDGRIGHTGSMNLIAEHYHKRRALRHGLHWRELMMRLEGPVVRELDAVFVTDWYSETDELLDLAPPVDAAPAGGRLDAQVLPSGPSFENDNNLKLFTAAIHNARHRVSVTSPYYVPDETVQAALVTAASRGLDVELFVAETSDQLMVYHAQRSYYEELLRAGVKIYLYRSPTVLHAKHLSLDEEVAIIGTSNMDVRSLSLHMELMVLVVGRSLVADLRRVEDEYRARSRLLDLQEWLDRPRRERWLDNLMRLTSSLM